MTPMLPPTRALRWALAALLLPAACVVEPDDELLAADDADAPRLAGAVEPGEPQTMLIRYWNGPTMRGSATLIAPNVVVTNAHASFGGPEGMYVQRGTQTEPGIDPLQVVEKLHHPDYVSAGDSNDIALLRLGCNVTDIAPAKINRTALASVDIGSSITAVGYGPTTWTGTDWGIKRSMGNQLTGFNGDWIWVSGVSANPGDSGGSLYGFPSGAVGPGGDDGADALQPADVDEAPVEPAPDGA
ncbi:MAG: trypsin-like serine protease, partial [Myxococcales bacterium]|nr:trypsin-like serine protease [Myxococcales bacterium]